MRTELRQKQLDEFDKEGREQLLEEPVVVHFFSEVQVELVPLVPSPAEWKRTSAMKESVQ
jgi:hypothetical protein